MKITVSAVYFDLVPICNLSLFIFFFFRLLLVGGCESAEVGISKASSCGLSAWRVLSGSPYYKQVTNCDNRVPAVRMSHGLSAANRLRQISHLEDLEEDVICLERGKGFNASDILLLSSNIKFI